tara:strand:+ start:155 stop:301 length:147 start_codon:yes stop_codon:yes gene_type:complete
MATYIALHGVKVQSLAADTTVEGQVWYRTDTGALKFYNGTSAQTVTVT